MLNSKDLLARAKISRATLNNYINLGLLPKPVVKSPEEGGTRARRLGYFPDSTLNDIGKIEAMKREGLRMDTIVEKLRADDGASSATTSPGTSAKSEGATSTPADPPKGTAWRPPEPVKDEFTPQLATVAVMVVQLDQVDRITAELPHDECFQLVNQLWGTATLIAKRFGATLAPYGRSSLVAYFRLSDESNHVMTAFRCARALQIAMHPISEEWRNRKGWTNDIRLNIGIDEGHERFGAIRAGERAVFAVFGETMDRAVALATVGRGGALWTTKNSMGALDDDERTGVGFGIRHREENGHDFTVRSTYARLSDLLDGDRFAPEVGRSEGVIVTEVFDVAITG